MDEFAETIVNKDGKLFYRYGKALRPVTTRQDHRAVPDEGRLDGERTFTVYVTHHGPIVRRADGKWIADAADEEADRGAGAELPAHEDATTTPAS